MAGEKPETPQCVACDRTGEQVPLITLDFRGKKFRICPQHLPMLIHDPQSLVGKLPGAEGMEPADHHD
jgi:hexokinase